MEFIELYSRGFCVVKNLIRRDKVGELATEMEFSSIANCPIDFTELESIVLPKMKELGTGVSAIRSAEFIPNGDGVLRQDVGLVCILSLDTGSFSYSECSHGYGYLGGGPIDKSKFTKLTGVSTAPGDAIIHNKHTVYKQNERPKCRTIKFLSI